MAGVADDSGSRPRFDRIRSDSDITLPVDTPCLFGLLLSPNFLFPGRTGIIPRDMRSLAHGATRPKFFGTFLLTLLRLMWLITVAICLACVTLNADVTVMVAVEALLDPAGTVVELALVNLTYPC